MKLRLRSVETTETFKVDVPTPLSLDHLKSVASALVSASPSSLHLSLNRRDELPSPLTLASGDLLFFTTNPLGFSSPNPNPNPNPSPNPNPNLTQTPTPPPPPPPPPPPSLTSPPPLEPKPEPPPPSNADDETDSKILDVTPSSVPGFLRRAIEADSASAAGDLPLLVVAIHAALLESGFLVQGGGHRLPGGWAASPSGVVSAAYTVPGASDSVKLNVSLFGKFAIVYGCFAGSDAHRVCLDAGRFVPAIASSIGNIGRAEEAAIFEMWKKVKDKIVLPLLIDLCEKSGLPPPPCFARLPTELKIAVLDLLPGVDLARAACVSSELRYLASNDDLWAKKIVEEFGYTDVKGLFGERWKNQYVFCWRKRKRQSGVISSGHRPRMPAFWDRRVPFPPPRFNIIGGDYDRFPAIGGRGFVSARPDQALPRTPARQRFSPSCNFGAFGR